MTIRFSWDGQKAERNRQKHGVTFEEAQTVFADPDAVIIPDEWHSGGEDREIIIGHSARQRVLFVAFTERMHHLIRIISARLATAREQAAYEQRIAPE